MLTNVATQPNYFYTTSLAGFANRRDAFVERERQVLRWRRLAARHTGQPIPAARDVVR